MDRGYLDFARLYALNQIGAYFVIRARCSLQYVRMHSLPVDPDTGVRSDQIIVLAIEHSQKGISRTLAPRSILRCGKQTVLRLSDQQLRSAGADRRLAVQEPVASGTVLQVDQAASADQAIHRHIAQRGKTQIWIAICVYVQVAILKKQLHLPQSLHKILRILDAHAFEKLSLVELLGIQGLQKPNDVDCNQLRMFEL